MTAQQTVSHKSILRTIDYIRTNDCDFITVDTLRVYTGCTVEQAEKAIAEVMGTDFLSKTSQSQS
jgi:hypothetical protein